MEETTKKLKDILASKGKKSKHLKKCFYFQAIV